MAQWNKFQEKCNKNIIFTTVRIAKYLFYFNLYLLMPGMSMQKMQMEAFFIPNTCWVENIGGQWAWFGFQIREIMGQFLNENT